MKMKSRTTLAVAAVLALALAGCAESGDDTATGSSSAPTTSTSSATTSTASSTASPSTSGGTGQDMGTTLLTFTRTGGLAGTNDKLTVQPDGSWALMSKSGAKQGKLTPVELATLKTTMENIGFSKLPKNNEGGTVADGFTYSITYGGDTVTAKDGAVPPALQPVISTLNGLLS